jgi:hypothetical protein
MIIKFARWGMKMIVYQMHGQNIKSDSEAEAPVRNF